MHLFYKITKFSIIVLFVIGVFVNTPSALESNASPLQSLFMMKQLIPQTQTIGLMWNQSKTNTNDILPKIERASASIGVKVVIEDVEELRDVSQKFRELKETYHVQAIWIIDNNDPMASSVGKDYLIKNSIVNGIALFAPTTDWVSAGACAALLSDGTNVKLYVNKKTISALGIKVPDKYLQDTQFVATN
jgi:ABC transporter substrate binding protein